MSFLPRFALLCAALPFALPLLADQKTAPVPTPSSVRSMAVANPGLFAPASPVVVATGRLTMTGLAFSTTTGRLAMTGAGIEVKTSPLAMTGRAVQIDTSGLTMTGTGPGR
jgi:hypothetical protein